MKQHLLYLREVRKPVACVAILEDGEKSAYQMSSLSHKDLHFDKPLARLIASGRLAKHPIQIILPEEGTFHALARTVVSAIIEDKTAPTRTRNAAKEYMVHSLANAPA